MSIGNRVVVFQEARSSIICYHVDKDEWSEESCKVTKNLDEFTCVKVPLY